MKLLQRLRFWRKPKGYKADHYYGIPGDIDDVMADPQTIHMVSDEPKVIRGGIRKAKHKQFTLDEHRHGGRIVKTMPRNLRQMKELSEKTDD